MFSISQDLALQGISGISQHFYCASINPQHKIFLKNFFSIAFINTNVRYRHTDAHRDTFP